MLSETERVEMARFVFAADRRRYAYAHGAMRHLIGRYLGVSPASVRLTPDELGKPHVAGSSLHVSLAHADELALVAFGSEASLGVDVERIRPMPDADSLARYAFTERERAHLEKREGTGELMRLWTRKEALLKATGQGLRTDPRSVDVLEAEALPGWRLLDLQPAEGYAAALAVRPHVTSVVQANFDGGQAESLHPGLE